MSAIVVVVRPPAHHINNRVAPQSDGVLDVVVDGINLTAKVQQAQALPVLSELAHCIVNLSTGKQRMASLQLYSEQDVWELGLEADGEQALVSLFRTGSRPEIAVYQHAVSLVELRRAVRSALDQEIAKSLPPPLSNSLAAARTRLRSEWPCYVHPKMAWKTHELESLPDAHFSLGGSLLLRQPAEIASHYADNRLERADLHSLLLRGELHICVSERTISLAGLPLFLVAERLVMLAEDVLNAWQCARPLFVRCMVDGVRFRVQRGPDDGPLSVTVHARRPATREPLTFPEIPTDCFVRAVRHFADSLVETLVFADPAQQRNLRVSALLKAARGLQERLDDTLAQDTVTNPDPDEYRCYGVPARRAETAGRWSHGGKMRFLPRWVATVPNIDTRATFLCGDRLLVGSAREMAAIERSSGQILWRHSVPRALCVATPIGVARVQPDGAVKMHGLETGEVLYRTQMSPPSGGGIKGALVNTPGLPRLLVFAEGDRSVTAFDLMTGEMRWRYTGRRVGPYRMRRAGRLLLVSCGDTALTALDVATGQVVWKIRDRLPFSGDISVDADAAFAICGGPIGPAILHQIDLWTGELRLRVDLDDRPSSGQPPLLTPHHAVVITRDRRGSGALALDRHTGEKVWEHAPGLTSATTAWLSIDDALIANSASGTLLCVDSTTGVLRYNHVFSRHVEADHPRRLEPILRNGAVFVPQHKVHVIRPRDGEVIGDVPCDLIVDLLRVDECCSVYVVEESGHVAAFAAAPRLTLVK